MFASAGGSAANVGRDKCLRARGLGVPRDDRGWSTCADIELFLGA